jgi:hypothetical protein
MKSRILITSAIVLLGIASCTKLDTKLQSSILFNPSSGNADVKSLLNGVYNDYNGLVGGDIGQLFSLSENTSDEALVPTRGGDWDDNGVWRQLHAHTWSTVHDQVTTVFTNLGQMESDALSTLAAGATGAQADEALFLRSVAQYHYLDLFGQVPYRLVADYNSLKAAPVMQPADAIDTLVTTLTGIISRNAIPASNVPLRASVDAAKFLLMKVLLNKGAFINRTAPTFDAADMDQVVSLGTSIITSAKYTLTPEYFDNFSPYNANRSKEAIWSWPNTGAATFDGRNSLGINSHWMNTLHYNSWDAPGKYGGAGWNGFSTVSDFYLSFQGANPDHIDTTKDQRLGGRFYKGVTDISGLRPGMLAFQQYNEGGKAEVDRHGNPLAFTPAVNLVETDPNTLEVTGVRVIKYAPDYNAYDGGNQTNQLVMFRFADVVLMVAEGQLRGSAGAGAALTTVNALYSSRCPTCAPYAAMDLATLLAERGREMYWESWRRNDLIRFGKFLDAWALKPADNGPKNLIFPIPSAQLIANPNLKQNPGY